MPMIKIDLYITNTQLEEIEKLKGETNRSEYLRRIIDDFIERKTKEGKMAK
jgi:metal-responsive CopG/Arc/MetJ family transcriptional regulator